MPPKAAPKRGRPATKKTAPRAKTPSRSRSKSAPKKKAPAKKAARAKSTVKPAVASPNMPSLEFGDFQQLVQSQSARRATPARAKTPTRSRSQSRGRAPLTPIKRVPAGTSPFCERRSSSMNGVPSLDYLRMKLEVDQASLGSARRYTTGQINSLDKPTLCKILGIQLPLDQDNCAKKSSNKNHLLDVHDLRKMVVAKGILTATNAGKLDKEELCHALYNF